MEIEFMRLPLTEQEFRYIVSLVASRPIAEALPLYLKLGEQERARQAPQPAADKPPKLKEVSP
jgi:hypothetical protein